MGLHIWRSPVEASTEDHSCCDEGSSLGTGTVGQLLTNRPELKSPVAGYHVVAGAYPSSALTPGLSLPTVDVERTPGQPDRAVALNVTAPLKVGPSSKSPPSRSAWCAHTYFDVSNTSCAATWLMSRCSAFQDLLPCHAKAVAFCSALRLVNVVCC